MLMLDEEFRFLKFVDFKVNQNINYHNTLDWITQTALEASALYLCVLILINIRNGIKKLVRICY